MFTISIVNDICEKVHRRFYLTLCHDYFRLQFNITLMISSLHFTLNLLVSLLVSISKSCSRPKMKRVSLACRTNIDQKHLIKKKQAKNLV